MSFKLIVKIMEEVDLPRPQTAILLAMAENANDDGGQCFPSVDRIAWKAGYKPRQVSNIIRDLEKSKVVNKVAEATRHRPVEYKIMIENAPEKLSFDLWKKKFSRHKGKDLGVQSRDNNESRDAVSQHLGMQFRDSRDAMDCTLTSHRTIQEEPSSDKSSSDGDPVQDGQPVAKEKPPSKQSIAKEFSDEFLRVTGISNLGWSRSQFFAFAERLSANPDLTLDEFSRCSESLWSEDFWKGKLTPFNVLDKYPAWAVANRPPEVLPPTAPTDWDLFNQQETERLMSMFGGSDD